MSVCGLRTLFLIVCVLELIFTVQRQIFDFLGYMWLPIVANFLNILLIIFGAFGAVQYITKYLVAYATWCLLWLTWNIFLICYYLNLGTLNRESGVLSLGTGSVSWWEGNGWGCQSVWGELAAAGALRPERVEGCLLPWHYVELAQAALATVLAVGALPLTAMLTVKSFRKVKETDKKTLPRRPVYTIELSPAEAATESSLKPMTPRRVKRRSGSRGAGSVRRSRRSYRNSAYLASTASLPRDRLRPASAHSSYSNFHAARPASYHAATEREEPPPPPEPAGYDVVGPYGAGYETMRYEAPYEARARLELGESPYGGSYGVGGYGGVGAYGGVGGYGAVEGEAWEAPPPPAPPYSARATPQAPGPPAYQPGEHYAHS